MPRKRVKSKRKAKELASSQFWNLMLSRSDLPDKYRPAWPSPFERKRAWFEHRDRIMVELLDDGGYFGHRPGAWWSYEAPALPRLPGEEDWEFLIRAGEVGPEERGKILAHYVFTLETKTGWLQAAFKYSPAEFEEACRKLERQAHLLGDVAMKKWSQILKQASAETSTTTGDDSEEIDEDDSDDY